MDGGNLGDGWCSVVGEGAGDSCSSDNGGGWGSTVSGESLRSLDGGNFGDGGSSVRDSASDSRSNDSVAGRNAAVASHNSVAETVSEAVPGARAVSVSKTINVSETIASVDLASKGAGVRSQNNTCTNLRHLKNNNSD